MEFHRRSSGVGPGVLDFLSLDLVHREGVVGSENIDVDLPSESVVVHGS